MTTEHPITPPPDLVEQWVRSSRYTEGMLYPEGYKQQEIRLATQAARWGADQELKACVDWLNNTDVDDSQEAAKDLRDARRPKQPSLKEQAIAALQVFGPSGDLTPDEVDTIRRALESLPD